MERSNQFNLRGLSTAIGSLPYTDASYACELVLKNLKEVPAWPQLPKLNFKENMYVQFSEGIPGIVLDEENEKVYFQVNDNLSYQIQNFLTDNLSPINVLPISEKYAPGLYIFEKKLKEKKPATLLFIKGQITGPITFGLAVTDENKKASLYHPELAEVITLGLTRKALFQIERFKKIHPEVIIFIDEPYLATFGSAYVNLSKEEVITRLNQVISPIKNRGAWVGIHCCANTDWGVVLETEIDIVNFDAVDYAHNFILYDSQIKNFLRRGGIISWGIIPADGRVLKEGEETLLKSLEEKIKLLTNKGVSFDELINRLLITPSCGLGSQKPEVAERVMELLSSFSLLFRNKYFK